MKTDEIVYLDHAAATPCDKSVTKAMLPYFNENFYNPSSPYAQAIDVRHDYEEAKHRLAMVFGGRGDDCIMTAGATESINLAMTAAKDAHIVSTTIEHHAVLHSVQNYDHTLVPVNKFGQVDMDELKKSISPKTQLVTIGLANNEIGTIQPIREISAIVAEERMRRLKKGDLRPIWLHSDASQAAGLIDVNVSRLALDMITLNAAKCYGPKQVGLLWRRPGVHLETIIFGGGQESNLRSGTENVAGVIGFMIALEKAEKKRAGESERLKKIRDDFQKGIAGRFPQAVVSGHPKKRLANNLHISFPGLDAERILFSLESKGVLVATGSACAANSGTRSHALEAIGLEDKVSDGSLRLTFGRLTNTDNSKRALSIICEEVEKEYSRMKS